MPRNALGPNATHPFPYCCLLLALLVGGGLPRMTPSAATGIVRAAARAPVTAPVGVERQRASATSKLKLLRTGAAAAPVAAATSQMTFNGGSLIIPMDNSPDRPDGQDDGMLRAYGLVHALLRNHVPVHWVINPDKPQNGVDFVISSGLEDFESGAALVSPRAYRGGPFVIDSADAAAALPVIKAWQAVATDRTAVHRLTTGSFTQEVARTLLAAPRVAVLRDGNEGIAFNNLNAAGIPDSVGGAWSSSSPDQLTEDDVAGPSTSSTDDGALFHQPSKLPRYSHLIAMHYFATSRTAAVVPEVRSWLDHGPLAHAFMQCEATRVFENAPGGLFLTVAGLDDDGSAPNNFTFSAPSHPLSQSDGTFDVDSGSVESMRAVNDAFKTGAMTLINESGSTLTRRIVLLTGRLDGDFGNGKVTYLAGHDYSVALPVSSNPQTNGVRLFLNALFEADALTVPAQDVLTLTKSAPEFINAATANNTRIQYTITYGTSGARPAENLRLTEVLPPGATYVAGSAAPAPASTADGVLTWDLPPLPAGGTGAVSFSVTVAGDGSYTNAARMNFSHLTVGAVASNAVTTTRDTVAPTVTIPGGPENPAVTSDSTPSFVFSVGGSPSAVTCRVDDAAPAPCSSPFTAPSALSGGAHTFFVTAADAAGNVGEGSHPFVVETAPTDSDNDGVGDGADQCPGTPAGTAVNASGCPLAASKEQCKGDGWRVLRRADNTAFKSQGECALYVKTGR